MLEWVRTVLMQATTVRLWPDSGTLSLALKFTKKNNNNNYANLLNCACQNTQECINFTWDIEGNIFLLAL